jgi:hypothetical protein
VQAAARAYRLAQRSDFLLGGKWKPVVDWADTDPEIPEEEMAKVGFSWNILGALFSNPSNLQKTCFSDEVQTGVESRRPAQAVQESGRCMPPVSRS